MITTAANGPGPSGLASVLGIRSAAPVADVVAMDSSEVAPAQPPRTAAQSAIAATAQGRSEPRPPRAIPERFYVDSGTPAESRSPRGAFRKTATRQGPLAAVKR